MSRAPATRPPTRMALKSFMVTAPQSALSVRNLRPEGISRQVGLKSVLRKFPVPPVSGGFLDILWKTPVGGEPCKRIRPRVSAMATVGDAGYPAYMDQQLREAAENIRPADYPLNARRLQEEQERRRAQALPAASEAEPGRRAKGKEEGAFNEPCGGAGPGAEPRGPGFNGSRAGRAGD